MYKFSFLLHIFIIVSDIVSDVIAMEIDYENIHQDHYLYMNQTSKVPPLPIWVNITYTFSSNVPYFILAPRTDPDTYAISYSGLTQDDYDNGLNNPTYLFDDQSKKYCITKINVKKSEHQNYLPIILVKMTDIIGKINQMEEHEISNPFNSVVVLINLNQLIVLDAWFVSSIKRLIDQKFDFNGLNKASDNAPLEQSFLQAASPKQPKLRCSQLIFNYILFIWSYIKFWCTSCVL